MLNEHLEPLFKMLGNCVNHYATVKLSLEGRGYDDSNIPDERYPIGEEAKKDRIDKLTAFIAKLVNKIDEEAEISSLYMARAHAMSLCEDYMDDCRCFTHSIEKRDGLEFLYVEEHGGDYKELVDVAEKIDETCYRNMLDESIEIDGKAWSILSFMPDRHKEIYAIAKDIVKQAINK